MKIFLLAILSMLTSFGAFAGANNAEINCVSASGRTKVYAYVPGDFAEYKVKFSIDGKVAEYVDTYGEGKNADFTVQDKLENKSYELFVLQRGELVFGMEALAKNLRYSEAGSTRNAEFTAEISPESVDPRAENGKTLNKTIYVSCKFHYSI